MNSAQNTQFHYTASHDRHFSTYYIVVLFWVLFFLFLNISFSLQSSLHLSCTVFNLRTHCSDFSYVLMSFIAMLQRFNLKSGLTFRYSEFKLFFLLGWTISKKIGFFSNCHKHGQNCQKKALNFQIFCLKKFQLMFRRKIIISHQKFSPNIFKMAKKNLVSSLVLSIIPLYTYKLYINSLLLYILLLTRGISVKNWNSLRQMCL